MARHACSGREWTPSKVSGHRMLTGVFLFRVSLHLRSTETQNRAGTTCCSHWLCGTRFSPGPSCSEAVAPSPGSRLQGAGCLYAATPLTLEICKLMSWKEVYLSPCLTQLTSGLRIKPFFFPHCNLDGFT